MVSSSNKTQKKLDELGIPPKIRSVEDLVAAWDTLTDTQREEGYFLLSAAEKRGETSNFQIRPYNPGSDFAAVSSLRSYVQASSFSTSEQPLSLNDLSEYCHVAVKNHRVRGYVLFEDIGASRHIHEVAVDRRFRHQGISAGLISSLEGELPLSLLVHPTNHAAKSLFHQLGFIQRGCSPGGYLFLVK